ncbi:MAG: glycosyltransferase family 4 protein [Crocinitomicaceae bacterium]|nr:glycosyltransferase family 4 protein [Crocinitomicaceae bacterium]
MKTIAIFHPSSELYGADRILVHAINSFPKETRKIVYLKSNGPLVKFIDSQSINVEIKITPNLPIIYRKLFSFGGILKFMSNYIKFNHILKRDQKKYNFQSAYVNTLACSLFLPLLKRRKIKSFIHVHEIIEKPALIKFVTAKISFKYAAKVLCVSNAVAANIKTIKNIDLSKIEVLHNGIKAINVSQKKATESKTQFYLFGRIMKKKGQWLVIKAIESIPKSKLENVQFNFVGGCVKGQEEKLQELKDLIHAKGLSHLVQFKPFVSDIKQYMEQSDVCLVPSIMKDPFPTTVLEAMSAGKAVIASNGGGAKEALHMNQCGLIIESNNPNALARSIIHLIENKSEILRLGKKAKEVFKTHFSLEVFKWKWMNFISANDF